MKILQLCKKNPYPPKDGEAIAISRLIQAFSELGHELSVLYMNTPKHQFDLNKFPEDFAKTAGFHQVDVDTSIVFWEAFKNLFQSSSYNIDRFYSTEYGDKLIEILQAREFDVIQLEGLYLTTYIPIIRTLSNAKIVLRSHNIEGEIWQRSAQLNRNPLKRKYFNFLAKRLLQWERKCLKEYDAIVSISTKDAEWYASEGWSGPLFNAPAGMDLSTIDRQQNCPPNLLFLGGLDWLPNLDGLNWFLKEVRPVLHRKYPAVEFFVAGRNCPKHLLRTEIEGVTVLGEVESVKNFMKKGTFFIVPLFSGSGMRIKIIEAMAYGKIVFSTRIGAEGIEYTDGTNIFMADSAEDFIHRLDQLMMEREDWEKIGQNAEELVRRKYGYLEIGQELLEFYTSLLKS